ncbi:hypothetical protein RHGRI_025518 [Rhododendron griersonianum]|uniref:Glycoside hydrolase family 3 C-terminal domain-containing protein n=1 Tax=Rhododendron griersonianum TaxID=479676 RepID=A0AAV6IQQ4_9ERIC|nr:hypothetical protein RHGRI_025518 [Rhododendron griersonianum]
MCLCWAAVAKAEYEKYKDPKQHINVRIKDLMGRMTLEEKIGQMTQIERTVASAEVIKKECVEWGRKRSCSKRIRSDMDRDGKQFPERDPELVKKIGAATALEVRATGVQYTFAHVLRKKVAACAKHYVGDGGTTDGINANNTEISWKGLLSIHMPAYANAVANGVSTVMISFSSWNGVKMHSNRKLITGYLKNTLRFNIMVPYNYTQFIDVLTSLVKKEFIPMTRIDDAVKRILRVKFTSGLFESPNGDYSFVNYLGCQEHRELAREAVRKSLVLLKNGKSAEKPLLPLPKKASKILVAGTHADNLGYQCGTTVLTAIKNTVDPTTEVVYNEDPDPSFVETGEFSYALVVVGEHTYAETAGDSFNLTIPDPGPSIITNVCGAVECVVVLITGRPVVIQQYVGAMDALVAAWLPGTEGQGVADVDVLFGDYGFTGKLSRTWFKTVDQLPMNVGDPHYDPLFPFGFGLTTKPTKEP